MPCDVCWTHDNSVNLTVLQLYLLGEGCDVKISWSFPWRWMTQNNFSKAYFVCWLRTRPCQTFVITHSDGLSYVTTSPIVFISALHNCQSANCGGSSQKSGPDFLTVWAISPCMNYAILILSTTSWSSKNIYMFCHFVSVMAMYLGFLATLDSYLLLKMVNICL